MTRLATIEPLPPAALLDHDESRDSDTTMKARSPIDILIDLACGIPDPEPDPQQRRAATEDERDAARRVASDVIMHIDDMYPKMWEGVPKSARTSVRNTVHNSVVALLIQWSNALITHEMGPKPQ